MGEGGGRRKGGGKIGGGGRGVVGNMAGGEVKRCGRKNGGKGR